MSKEIDTKSNSTSQGEETFTYKQYKDRFVPQSTIEFFEKQPEVAVDTEIIIIRGSGDNLPEPHI